MKNIEIKTPNMEIKTLGEKMDVRTNHCIIHLYKNYEWSIGTSRILYEDYYYRSIRFKKWNFEMSLFKRNINHNE